MLRLEEISKLFDGEPVLQEISLTIQAGEVVALLGPSGSGKTTLLRIIAGLESAGEGQVLFDGQNLAQVAVHERGFGMVFQDYALFPHKDVAENVAFGLQMAGWNRTRIERRVEEMLDLVGLHGFGPRPVYELSGGEQQRVALARALAPSPHLLLLDEPLGALDRALRERLMGELRTILKEAGSRGERPITSIYVTHDQAEAFAVADRVVVLRRGQIEQVDTPISLYRHPRTPFVARFIGMTNLFEGTILNHSPPAVRTVLGDLLVAELSVRRAVGESGVALVRPEAGRLLGEGENAENVVTGRLVELSFRGRYQQATVETEEMKRLTLDFRADNELPAVGEKIRLSLDAQDIRFLPVVEEDLRSSLDNRSKRERDEV